MTAEWITAIGTIGTFVVITASAIAALLQLRHMRGNNQIVALTECRETIEAPDFRECQRFVSYDLPKRLLDPREVLRIAQPQSQFEGEYKAINAVANFFENLGTFVKNGIIEEQLACDLWAGVVLRNWNALVPVVTFVRREFGSDAIWENFEYLAVLCEDYIETHPAGSYPHRSRHMPKDTSFVDAVNAARLQSQ